MAKKKTRKNSKKSKVGKYIMSIIVIAIIVAAVYFLMQYIEPTQPVAIVNGEEITQAELDEKYEKLPEQYKVVITKELLLDQLINTKLLIQEAKLQEIIVTDNETKAEIERIKDQFESEEDFNTFLEESELTIEQVTDQINEQLLINKLLDQEILSKLKIEERDIKLFYNQNKDALNVSYSKIKDRINETLYQEQSSKAINTYIEQLKSKAEIIIPGKELEAEEEIVEEEEETEAEEAEEEIVEEEEETEAEEIEIIEEEPSITSFELTEDEICIEDEKPITILFTVSSCEPCDALKESFEEATEDVAAYIWELDIGDNLLTEEVEKGITKSALEVFKKYNKKSTVPTIVAGCKYIGIGKIDSEEISLVVDKLLE